MNAVVRDLDAVRRRWPSTLEAGRLIEPLTQREMETLELVCDGLSNEEIALFCKVTHATVKWHLLNIFGKLGVKRRTQAVAAAIYLELVRPAWLDESARRYEGRAADKASDQARMLQAVR